MKMKGDNRFNFNDISDHWAESDIKYAATVGWVNGYPDNTFKPDQPITRAELVTLVNRMLRRIPEAVDDLLDGMIYWPDNSDADEWYYIAIQEASNSHEPEYKPEKRVPGLSFDYERWAKMVDNNDWRELEASWIRKRSK
jgi:hypothetical protein